MSPEALQQVADILQNLSEDAKSALVWYLIATQGVSLLKFIAGMSVVIYGIYAIKNALAPLAQHHRRWRILCDAAGLDSECVIRSDMEKLRKCLREHYKG